MGVDYYNILKVNRNAKDDDLKKAYKRLAMVWHPDKNPTWRRPEAEARFKQISEAYDVLSDPLKRQIYDQHGDEALKNGVHPFPTSSSSSSSSKQNNNPRPSRFKPRPPEDIYEEFFGEEAKKETSMKKGEPSENTLYCCLEELYSGANKKMKISRHVFDTSGKVRTVEEILTIVIKPGWKKGTRITFPGKGNIEAGVIPADLVFIVDEKPHQQFKRDGNDLVIVCEITLLESLVGKSINLTTLDGRNLGVQLTDIVKAGHEVIVPNEGMPISKDRGMKGNLRIKVDVKYPTKKFTSEQKMELRRILGAVR